MNVYFDNAATTALDAEVLKEMLNVLQNKHGNPSSIHSYGREAKAMVGLPMNRPKPEINTTSLTCRFWALKSFQRILRIMYLSSSKVCGCGLKPFWVLSGNRDLSSSGADCCHLFIRRHYRSQFV